MSTVSEDRGRPTASETQRNGKAFPAFAGTAVRLLAERRFAEIGKRLTHRIHGHWTSYGLRRDLEVPFAAPKAKIPIAIRELTDGDIPILLSEDGLDPDSNERQEIEVRRAHVEAGIPQCYVAVDQQSGTPCYFQWLMGPAQNDRIQAFFGGRFPVLRPDEALLENAYTPPRYRGKGIMAAAMALIAERAVGLGARYVITFVDQENIPSLKGCTKAGFRPYLERHDRRILFHVRRSFEALPEGFLMPYERAQRPAAA